MGNLCTLPYVGNKWQMVVITGFLRHGSDLLTWLGWRKIRWIIPFVRLEQVSCQLVKGETLTGVFLATLDFRVSPFLCLSLCKDITGIDWEHASTWCGRGSWLWIQMSLKMLSISRSTKVLVRYMQTVLYAPDKGLCGRNVVLFQSILCYVKCSASLTGLYFSVMPLYLVLCSVCVWCLLQLLVLCRLCRV